MTDFMDVHTHLHDPRIAGDLADILTRAGAAGLRYMVTCATMENNFKATARLAETYPGILPCFGIHPWFLDTLTPGWEIRLGACLESLPSGVGETGLDFSNKAWDRKLQIQVFETHLALARELNRPITIHIRKAWDPLVHILKKYGPLNAGGMVHSYSGSAELVRVLEAHNLYISFSGSVTRPNAKKIVLALNAVSLGRILFETDTPDIYPSFDPPFPKNRLNEPANLPGIVKMASDRRKIGFEKLAIHGYTNGLKLFEPLMDDR